MLNRGEAGFKSECLSGLKINTFPLQCCHPGARLQRYEVMVRIISYQIKISASAPPI